MGDTVDYVPYVRNSYISRGINVTYVYIRKKLYAFHKFDVSKVPGFEPLARGKVKKQY